jgi:YVTN family beta-propeller protein
MNIPNKLNSRHGHRIGLTVAILGAILSPAFGLAGTLSEPAASLPSNTIVATIPVGSTPASIAVSPNNQTVYVANYDAGTVSVIDTATNTVTFTITVGNLPSSLAVAPDGSTLYVVSEADDTVSVISTANNEVTATLAIGKGSGLITISPDGTQAYVTHDYLEFNYKGTISVIDTGTNQITTPINYGRFDSESILFAPDGNSVYLTATNEFGKNVTFGQKLFVIDPATQTITSSVTLPAAKNYVGYDFMTISPDGTKLYIDGTDKLFVYDTSDNTRVKAISVTGSLGIPAATPDGSYVYVPIYSTTPSTIVMIATAHYKIVGQPITVGNGASRMAIAPDGDYAYVPNGTDNTVSVINIQPQ